jgi:hypothetical protein
MELKGARWCAGAWCPRRVRAWCGALVTWCPSRAGAVPVDVNPPGGLASWRSRDARETPGDDAKVFARAQRAGAPRTYVVVTGRVPCPPGQCSLILPFPDVLTTVTVHRPGKVFPPGFPATAKPLLVRAHGTDGVLLRVVALSMACVRVAVAATARACVTGLDGVMEWWRANATTTTSITPTAAAAGITARFICAPSYSLPSTWRPADASM